MRAGLVALLMLVLGSQGAFAAEGEGEEAPDPWIGCWERVYDAAHLTKHPGQLVTALTLSVYGRDTNDDSDQNKYFAEVTAKMRKSAETYSNRDAAKCRDAGSGLSCAGEGFFPSHFSLEASGANMKLVIKGGDFLTLVPGVDTSALTVLSPANPEHTLFLLKPTACG